MADLELPTYLTVHEVASMLRLSEKSVYALVRDDAAKIPAVRLGGSVRFPKDRLLAWLRSREQGRAERPIRKRVRSTAKSAPRQEADGA
jgi:excisionase family DNA binding protein